MKILFIMASSEYLRYYDSTICMLAERGHTVHLAINKENTGKNPGKSARVESLAEANPRVIISGIVPQRTAVWQAVASGLRGSMDYIRFLHPRFVNAPGLRARMVIKGLPGIFRLFDRIRSLSPLLVRRLVQGLAAIERAIPSDPGVQAFIKQHQPDVLFVTPLIEAASEQVDLVKSAKALGIRAGVGIASWDNLTNKGLIRIQPDTVFVWNECQKSEATEFHHVPPENVVVTGAQLFDRWFERQPSRTRDAFCHEVGLPTSQPIILFMGSSQFISAADVEVEFVRTWLAAIRQSAEPAVREASVLIRPYPYKYGQWDCVDLSPFGDVAVWPRHSFNPVNEDDRTDYFDSMHHCAAVVGINTSAMVEAAILSRPVLTLLASEFKNAQEGTLHFQHLLPENGGFLRVGANLEAHIQQLAETLSNEEVVQQETRRFVASFVRPRGMDLPCTPILVDAIERLASTGPARPEVPPVWLFPVSMMLWVIGLIAVCNERLRSRKFRKRVREQVKALLHLEKKSKKKKATKKAVKRHMEAKPVS